MSSRRRALLSLGSALPWLLPAAAGAQQPSAPAPGAAPRPDGGLPRRDLLLAQLPVAIASADAVGAPVAARLALARLHHQLGEFDSARVRLGEPAADDAAALTLAARLDSLQGRLDSSLQRWRQLADLTARLHPDEPMRQVSAWVGQLFVHYQRNRHDSIAALPFPAGAQLPLLAQARALREAPYRLAWTDAAAPGQPRQTRVRWLATDPLPVLPAEVDGQPLNLIFDTGADQLILDEAIAAKLGVAIVAQATGQFAGGLTAPVGFGLVRELRLGGLVLHEVPVQVMPTARFTFDKTQPVGGIVGTALMRQVLGTLDYAHGELHLAERGAAPPPRPAGMLALPFTLDATHLLHARGSIDDSPPLSLFIDSGLASPDALVLPRQTLELLGIALPQQQLSAPGAGGATGSFATGSVRVGRVALGSWVQREHGAAYGPLPPASYGARGFIQDGLLSHRFLRRSRRWTLDFDAREMRFELS